MMVGKVITLGGAAVQPFGAREDIAAQGVPATVALGDTAHTAVGVRAVAGEGTAFGRTSQGTCRMERCKTHART